MSTIASYLSQRLLEPSTWAGAGVGAVLIHTLVPGVLGDALLTTTASLAALAAILVPEKKS